MNTPQHIAVVTGGAKGIGRACVERFLQEGFKVGILDPADPGPIGPAVHSVLCDVRSEDSVRRAMEEIIGVHGEIGVLVNSAGIQRYSTVTETSEEEWDLVLGVNLKGAFFCAKHAIPSMLRRGSGCVINMASVNGIHCQKRIAPYTVSKAGLLALTRSIAVDYAPQVRSVAVCPGTVDTPMLHDALAGFANSEQVMLDINAMHLAGRIAAPEEIASLVSYLCRPEASFITGHEIRIDGGLGIRLAGN